MKEIKPQKRKSKKKLNNEFLLINFNYKQVSIKISEIIYIKAMSDFVIIETLNGKYSTLSTMIEILEKLPESLFIRVHRSYIVNLEKVLNQKGKVIFVRKDDIRITIPIGRTYMVETRNRLETFE